jgi:hypothetical protein
MIDELDEEVSLFEDVGSFVDRSTGAAHRFGVDVSSDRFGEFVECCRLT